MSSPAHMRRDLRFYRSSVAIVCRWFATSRGLAAAWDVGAAYASGMSDERKCEVCGEPVTDADPGRVVDTLSAPAATLASSFTPTLRKDIYRHNRCP